MTRRAAVVLAAAALAWAPLARAAPPVPEPTVTWSVTGPAGTALPKGLTKASWSSDGTARGDGGTLSIDAVNPATATTVVDATFTTRAIKAYKGFQLLALKGTTTHTGAPSSSTPASYSYGLRWRPVGGAWSRWQDVSRGYPAGGPGGYEEHGGFNLANPPKLVQLQFRLHVEVTDAAHEVEEWQLQAL